MGRRKKNASVDQDVKSFSETKADSLTIFSKERESIPQDVIDKYDMKPVSKTSMLGGDRIDQFNGKNWEGALDKAYEWLERYNSTTKTSQASFVNYFPQIFMKKTILVGINIRMITE